MSNTLSTDALTRLAKGKTYLDIDDKVAFVTGAGSGIGLAMAHALAASGARLALLDIDGASLRAASQGLEAAVPGVQILTWAAAVNDEAAVEQAMGDVEAAWGRIDILFNNAGISMNQPTLELSGSDWRRTMDINVNGMFYCAQAAGRRMVARGEGVIINTASMYGVVAAPERAAYCTSKAAVAMLTKVLAVEWGKYGVRVNAIAPGYIQTALVDDLITRGRMDLGALIDRTPSGRLGRPEEIAGLAVFLASENASFINGHVVVADGGWSAYSYV